jgi:uncharacterized protein (TIGR02246 family)
MERIMVSDVAQIYELWNEYTAALTAGDMERWIALWIDDGIQMPPGASRRVGVEQIRASMQPLFDLYQWTITINPEEVRVLGDRAYSHGTYEFELTAREEGEILEGSGKYLTILKKQADGSWKVALDCFNYDAPLG